MVLGPDVDLVFAGDAGLLLDPMGLTSCLSIPHRPADASPWTDGNGGTEVEFFAFDFACVRHRGDVQVTADTANDLKRRWMCCTAMPLHGFWRSRR